MVTILWSNYIIVTILWSNYIVVTILWSNYIIVTILWSNYIIVTILWSNYIIVTILWSNYIVVSILCPTSWLPEHLIPIHSDFYSQAKDDKVFGYGTATKGGDCLVRLLNPVSGQFSTS